MSELIEFEVDVREILNGLYDSPSTALVHAMNKVVNSDAVEQLTHNDGILTVYAHPVLVNGFYDITETMVTEAIKFALTGKKWSACFHDSSEDGWMVYRSSPVLSEAIQYVRDYQKDNPECPCRIEDHTDLESLSELDQIPIHSYWIKGVQLTAWSPFAVDQ